MRIVAGTKRLAIVGNTYTVKVPNPSVGVFIKKTATAVFEEQILSRTRSKEKREIFQFIQYMFSQCITADWEKNCIEYKRSSEYGELAVPTLFSFLGLLNIQETAQPFSGQPFFTVIEALVVEFGYSAHIAPFGHALASGNFGFHHGKLKFVDYGNEALAVVVSRHRDTFEKVLASLHPLSF